MGSIGKSMYPRGHAICLEKAELAPDNIDSAPDGNVTCQACLLAKGVIGNAPAGRACKQNSLKSPDQCHKRRCQRNLTPPLPSSLPPSQGQEVVTAPDPQVLLIRLCLSDLWFEIVNTLTNTSPTTQCAHAGGSFSWCVRRASFATGRR